MVLTLDPRFPLVWRTPFSLQLGLDPAVVRLDDVTGAQERIIAALASGVSRPGLRMISHDAGVSDPELEELLAVLRPALTKPADTQTSTVLVSGTGQTVDRIAVGLAEAGVRVLIAATAPDAIAAAAGDAVRDVAGVIPEFAIAVGHFVLSAELHGLWLRRDIPHLPVVFSDSGVQIGPLVEPGITPCLYCLDRYRRDADPAWPAIATQLWGRRSAAETPLVSSEVAAIACRLTLRRLSDNRQPASSVRLDARTGEISRREVLLHPECGCSTLEGSDSAGVVRLGSVGRRPPRKVRASVAPG